MSDTNVKIKLSADGRQIREQIRLIDQDIQKIGKGGGRNSQTSSSSSSSDTQDTQQSQRDINAPSQTEDTNKKLEHRRLIKEITLIRKELQKLNKSGGLNQDGGSPPPPQPPNNGNDNNGSNDNQGGQGGQGGGNNNNQNSFMNMLGKLASAAVALKAASRAWNYLSSGAQSSASGESLAYKTYGSTLAYKDYYDAKKQAKMIGAPLGYDYNTVLSSADANMSKAGFTNINEHNADMLSIMSTAKAWGLDPTQLSRVSGYMTSIGVTANGEQRKFADLLADSIIEANMVGREDEQLQVLESIAENLSKTLIKVDKNSLDNALGVYNALSQTPELRGGRGANIVERMNDAIANGSPTMDILLGKGTDYVGLQGMYELMLEKEKGISSKKLLGNLFKNIDRYNFGKSGAEKDMIAALTLQNQFGITLSQANLLIANKDKILSGEYTVNEDGTINKATQDRLSNYGAADVRTQEQFKLEKQDTKEGLGEKLNNMLNPFRDWYSGLSDNGRAGVDVGVGGAKVAGGIAGIKGIGKAIEKFKGVGQGAAGSSDDIMRGVAGASKAAKGLGIAAIVVEGATTVYDAKKAHEKGDNRLMSKEIGEGAGAIGGGAGGAWAGAGAGAAIGSIVPGPGTAIGGVVGGIIGGIGGSFAGGAVGGKVGSGAYDLFTGGDKYSFTQAEKDMLAYHYKTAKELYNTEGNNSAQFYTKNSIVPYLNAIGVSKSISDSYTWDVGKPDFLKDYEKGVFDTESIVEETTKVYKENNKSIEDLTEATKSLESAYKTGRSGSYGSNSTDLSQVLQSEDNTKPEKKEPKSWLDKALSFMLPQHATGNDYVPYDNYMANLHKGEMVLTKMEAEEYRANKGGNNNNSETLNLNLNITGNIQGLTSDNQGKIVEAVVNQIKSSGLQNMIANSFTRVPNY